MNSLYDERYFRSRNYADYFAREERYHRMAEEILGFLRSIGYREQETILDYGCAFGYLVGGLVEGGANAMGYDVSEYALSRARVKRIPVVARPCPCEVLIALDVFEHMRDREVRAVLDKTRAAVAILRIPCSLDGRTFALEVSRKDPTHINCKRREGWLELLRSCGYAVARPLRLFTIYDTPGVLCVVAFGDFSGGRIRTNTRKGGERVKKKKAKKKGVKK